MEDVKPEEKSPLLLYMVEGDGNVSKNNKRVNFDKGRLYGISSGATAVFTEFPNYISPCWITTLFSSLMFLMVVLLMASSMGPSNSLRIPRCTHSNSEDLENKTIYLVHSLNEWNQEQLELLERIKNEYEGYDIHLVLLRPYVQKTNDITKLPNLEQSFTPQNRSETVTLARAGPTVRMNQAVIEIKRAKRAKKSLRNLKRKKREHTDKQLMGPMGIGFGMKSLLDILLRSRVDSAVMMKRNINDTKLLPNFFNFTEPPPPTTTSPRPKTLDDVICQFPGLSVQNITTEEAFAKSPLQSNWLKLNPGLMIFAVRVLHLWQYGGMSFKMDGRSDRENAGWEGVDNFSVAPEVILQTMKPNPFQILPIPPAAALDKLVGFILEGRKTFENLPKEVVAADDEGLHIFTKTPCHVFFGEVMLNLKRARGDEMPKTIIQKSLRVFCRHGAVGNNYCKNLFRGPGQI